MTTDRIGRICEGLTSREKAALAFSHMSRMDAASLDRVVATVPKRTYRIPELDFTNRLDGLGDMSVLWGLVYWKLRAFCETLHATVLILAQRLDRRKLLDDAMEALCNAESHLVALDQILQSVCDANGVDADAARWIAAVEGDPYRPITRHDTIPDSEFDASMRETLSLLAK